MIYGLGFITFCETCMFYHFVAHVFLHGVEQKKCTEIDQQKYDSTHHFSHLMWSQKWIEMGGFHGVGYHDRHMAGTFE